MLEDNGSIGERITPRINIDGEMEGHEEVVEDE